MFAIAIVAIVIGFVLILLIKRTDPAASKEAAFYEETDAATRDLGQLSLAELEETARALCSQVSLRVTDRFQPGPKEVDLWARLETPLISGQYIINCVLVEGEEVVPAARVTALSDTVKAERAAKGILITNGYFSENVATIPEGAPVELINVRRLRDLVEELRIAGVPAASTA